MYFWQQRIAEAKECVRRGETLAAQEILNEIIEGGDIEARPAALVTLGLLLADGPDREARDAALQAAVDSGHPIHSAYAALMLGAALIEEQRYTLARPLLHLAADSADPELAGRANVGLAHALSGLGDISGARRILAVALDSADPEIRAMAEELELPTSGGPDDEDELGAALQLAQGLGDSGMVDEAEEILERVRSSGHPHFASLAAMQLFGIRAAEEDYDEARELAEQIIELGHPEHLGWGYKLLGSVLQDFEDGTGAIAAFREAAKDPRPAVRLESMIQLGQELAAAGETEEAEQLYLRVINTGHPHFASSGWGVLAEFRAEQGDIDGAAEAFRKVIDSGHEELGPRAAYNLGVLLARVDDIAGARDAFGIAADGPDPEAAHSATTALLWLTAGEKLDNEPGREDAGPAMRSTRLALERGDIVEARTLLTASLHSDGPMHSAIASFSLGLLEAVHGDVTAARTALQFGRRSEYTKLAEDAVFLAALLDEPLDLIGPALGPRQRFLYDPAGAEEQWQQLAGTSDSLTDRLATLFLAEAAMHRGEGDAGSTLVMLAQSAHHPLIAARAALTLVTLGKDLVEEELQHDLLRRCLTDGHPALAPFAAAEVGIRLLTAIDDQDTAKLSEARSLFETALDSGLACLLPQAFGGLQLIYLATDDDRKQRAALAIRVAGSGHSTEAPKAALAAAELLLEDGAIARALPFLDQVAAMDGHDQTGIAAFCAHTIREEFDQAESSLVLALEAADGFGAIKDIVAALAHAFHDRGVHQLTEWIWTEVAAKVTDVWALHARMLLGASQNDRGASDAAVASWSEVARSVDSERAVHAVESIGSVWREQQAVSEPAILREIAAGDGPAAADAAWELGLGRTEADPAGAVAAYTRLIEVGSGDLVAMAAFNAALIQQRRGESARWFLRCAIEASASGAASPQAQRHDPERMLSLRAQALLRLGDEFRTSGDPEGATKFYTEALETGVGEVIGMARHWLGLATLEESGYSLSANGDTEDALAALTEHYGSVELAELGLAGHAGDVAAAAEALARYLGTEPADPSRGVAVLTLFLVGLHQAGETAAAHGLANLAIEHGTPEQRASAWSDRGGMAEQEGDDSLAVDCYRQALEIGGQAGAQCGRWAAVILAANDDTSEAIWFCERAVDIGGSESVPAGVLLGALYCAAGDVQAAHRAWDRAEQTGEPREYGRAFIDVISKYFDEDAEAGRRSDRHVPLLVRAAATKTDPATVAFGFARLADLASARGDWPEALRLRREALAVPDSGMEPYLHNTIGRMLMTAEDTDGAIAEFRLAADSGEKDMVYRAEYSLGVLYFEAGDRRSAAAAFAKAAACGIDASDELIENLVVVSGQQFAAAEHEDAIETLRLMVGLGQTDRAVRIILRLALESSDTDPDEQDTSDFDRQSADPAVLIPYLRLGLEYATDSVATELNLRLGETLLATDDRAAARRAFEQALAADSGDLGLVAGYKLYELLREQGEETAARELLTRLSDHGSGRMNSALKAMLSFRMAEEGDAASASDLLRSAAATEDDFSPISNYLLAQRAREQGDDETARAALRKVVESKDRKYADQALLSLGAMAYHEEDFAEARRWWEPAAASSDPQVAGSAAMNLGLIAKDRRDPLEGARWFLRLVDAGDERAPLAAAHLAELHYWRDEFAESAEHYGYTLANTDDPELIAEAAYRVGEIRAQAGAIAEAKELLDRAVRTEDETFASRAAALLKVL
ncbi:putative N-acetylglucosaminyl transferase [Actinoalloteichus hymeniacidonis]|uniref:N-acetylglucosaminyl transferase n=2 Tax=Actinoalloteichus hymeniacidonis TaxID=340345 RepID=A0AAC9HRP2_9PSEU|nr:putative N-acetylglucosaminyl transferase [Actinoalloteichus hymeniacidonis]